MAIAYEVALMRKSNFEGKKVVVLANDVEQAFHKARQAQHRCGGPNAWATIVAKPMGDESSKSRFQHKGIRYNR